jgi:hypothetical protein
MKAPKLNITSRLEYVDGYGLISIEMPKKDINKYILKAVFVLVDNHIKNKYLNCHRNKQGYLHQYVIVHQFTDYRLGISHILSKDFQLLLFDVLYLLSSNGYHLVFDQIKYKGYAEE